MNTIEHHFHRESAGHILLVDDARSALLPGNPFLTRPGFAENSSLFLTNVERFNSKRLFPPLLPKEMDHFHRTKSERGGSSRHEKQPESGVGDLRGPPPPLKK